MLTVALANKTPNRKTIEQNVFIFEFEFKRNFGEINLFVFMLKSNFIVSTHSN